MIYQTSTDPEQRLVRLLVAGEVLIGDGCC